MTDTSLSLMRRLWLSLTCAYRVLFDARFAAQVWALRHGGLAAQSPPTATDFEARGLGTLNVPRVDVVNAESSGSSALQLLSLLQREGRLLDFLEQEVTSFSDTDVGAAARLVHDGCRRALHAHARVVTVRAETEGAPLTLERASADVKLVGNVAGAAPFHGVLRHRGWRVEDLRLPTLVGAHDARVVAPAELELS